MKQKTGRKLLSWLLTLAMVVGLVPGMSLTAYAADGSETALVEDATTTGGVTTAKSSAVDAVNAIKTKAEKTLTVPEGLRPYRHL